MKKASLDFNRLRDGHLVFILLLVAFSIRIGRALLTPVVNFDAVIYLYQAKAIYHGFWDAVNACYYPHVTAPSIMAVLFYPLFQDWIWSLLASSILFGSLTVIPIFLLAKIFFDRPIAFLTALVYAVLHFSVSGSVEVIRDPPAWFFNALGLLFFASAIKKNQLLLFVLSSVFFLLAAWNRIESLIFLLVSFPFLLSFKTERKGRAVMAFLFPLLILSAAFLIYWSLFSLPANFLRLNDVIVRLKELPENYVNLRIELGKSCLNPPPGYEKFPAFFQQARTLLWFTALGVIIQRMAEGFNYLFFIFLVLGICAWFFHQNKTRLSYWLFSLSGAAFLVIYLSIIRDWTLEPRWLGLISIPSFIFMAYGLKAALFWVEKKGIGLEKGKIIILISLLILAFTLPREIQFHDWDKKVFREMGEVIAKKEKRRLQPINVSSLGAAGHFVTLYGNLHIPAPACPAQEWLAGMNSFDLPGKNYGEFIGHLQKLNIHYFVWEEKKWPPHYDLLKNFNPQEMEIVGTWRHRDTGKMVLFKIKGTQKAANLKRGDSGLCAHFTRIQY